MRLPRLLCALSALATGVTHSDAARALALDVPGTHATLQLAVAAAAASLDVDNTITISVSPLTTNATVDIGAAFGPVRQLVIRPAAALARASLVNGAPTIPVVNMNTAANVTLRDLDILRNVTNSNHLVVLSTCEDVTIERCRIGSNLPTIGTAGWSNVFVTYPTNVLLRNNILFARTPGTFDYGINAGGFNDPSNALRLYNNVVSDHRVYGVRVEAAILGPLVLLRNNVVVNHASLAPEPFAFRTEAAIGGPVVVTSHNVAYATAAFVQSAAGGTQDIAGLGASFLNFAKASVGPSFVTPAWTSAPPWDANTDFYRLVDGGPLHIDASQWGMTVGNVYPDVAVVDDIEQDIRPGGANPHTDRGADQLEPGTTLGVGPGGERGHALAVSPLRNPAHALELAYHAADGGRLQWLVLDSAGRVVHRAERWIGADSRGVLECHPSGKGAAGLVFYRVRLLRANGRSEQVTGKAVLVP